LERALEMTSDERRKLGINNSTLWYMKKNLESKDRVKIYDKVVDKVRSFE
jgi:hypothetical protein